MKLQLFYLLTAGLLILPGCSSAPSKVDEGPVQARTFSFMARSQRPYPGYVDKRQGIHDMIQQAITKNLATKGITKAPAGGDVTIGYLLIVGDNASITTINDYYGYTEDAHGLQDKAFEAYTGSKNPNYFEAGTLVIDVIDGTNFKLLKRGYASRPLLRDIPDDARAARIQEVVDGILRDLRIGN